jgi:hypothetical protein
MYLVVAILYYLTRKIARALQRELENKFWLKNIDAGRKLYTGRRCTTGGCPRVEKAVHCESTGEWNGSIVSTGTF